MVSFGYKFVHKYYVLIKIDITFVDIQPPTDKKKYIIAIVWNFEIDAYFCANFIFAILLCFSWSLYWSYSDVCLLCRDLLVLFVYTFVYESRFTMMTVLLIHVVLLKTTVMALLRYFFLEL